MTKDSDQPKGWRARAERINGYGAGSRRARQAEDQLAKLSPQGRDALLCALEVDLYPSTDPDQR